MPAMVGPWMSMEVLVGTDGMEVASGRFGGALGGGGRRAGPIAVQLPHQAPCKNFVCPQI